MPRPPAGYAACRVFVHGPPQKQISHLVVVGAKGGFIGNTLCGLTRFDQRAEDGRAILRAADLSGWSMNGGTSGSNIEQVKCDECWKIADDRDRCTGGHAETEIPRPGESWNACIFCGSPMVTPERLPDPPPPAPDPAVALLLAIVEPCWVPRGHTTCFNHPRLETINGRCPHDVARDYLAKRSAP